MEKGGGEEAVLKGEKENTKQEFITNTKYTSNSYAYK
jgi:hypothetical protein